MHFEKISENQIKCILTEQDLRERHLTISQLAYGSESAGTLFHEMLDTACEEFDFQAEDTPIMIEAVPMRDGGLVLIITRTENPDELDAHFARFGDPDADSIAEEEPYAPSADEFLDMFENQEQSGNLPDYQNENKSGNRTGNQSGNLPDSKSGNYSGHQIMTEDRNYDGQDFADDENEQVKDSDRINDRNNENNQKTKDNLRIYYFTDLDQIIELAGMLSGIYSGENSLYRRPGEPEYYLVMHQSWHTPQEFNRICNMMAEYAPLDSTHASREAFLREHYKCIAEGTALMRLAQF